MPLVTTRDGTRLFCRRWGDGPPVMFVHGWATSSDIWQSAMTLTVQAGFEAIAFDRRSHGRSDDPGRGYDYDTLADDLADVIEALGLTGLVLVGHSMGGGEIARYLTRHGAARVDKVTMVAPSLPFMLKCPDNPDGPSEPARVAEWHALWATHFTEWLGQAVAGAYGADAAAERVSQTLRIMLQCSPLAAIEVNAAVVGTDFRDELRRIPVPTLVLHGDADQSCPLAATGAKLPALMPDCRLKIYPGENHTMVGAAARRIVEDLLAFIGEPAAAKVA